MIGGTYEVTVERDVTAHMRDGITLYADVYRPRGSGPFPVLLVRTPYDKTVGGANNYVHPSWYARHGFVVAIQDTRGRWRSEGDWYPYVNERRDGYDSVEWAAGLPGSNGKVGMYGASYVGATQLQAAIEMPPHLGAIAPCVTASDYFESWTYEGGAFCLSFVLSWTLFLAMDSARRAGRPDLELALADGMAEPGRLLRTLPLLDMPLLRDSGLAPYFFDWLEHSSRDEYWRAFSVEPRWEHVMVPALHIGGWYDMFLDGTLRNFTGISARGAVEETRRAQRLLVGPWHHGPWTPYTGQADFGLQASSEIVDELQVRLFNLWLKGDDDGISREPPVKLFVMGENTWRDEHEWPLKRARNTPYYFHSDGYANSLTGDGVLSPDKPGDQTHDTYVYNPRSPAISLGGHSWGNPAIAPMGSFDQRPTERNRDTLCYTSATLDHPVEVTGPVAVELWAATSGADTDWVARLVDVHPDGHAMNLTEGILRARFRNGLERSEPIQRDTVHRYRVNLRGTSNVFLPGHRIRVDVSSSSFPHWDRNPNTGAQQGADTISNMQSVTQSVFHDMARPSHIILPIVPR